MFSEFLVIRFAFVALQGHFSCGLDLDNSSIVYKNVLYKFKQTYRVNFVQAEQYCKTNGGHLAKMTPTLMEDKGFVERINLMYLSGKALFPSICSWIGVSDRAKEGVWRWTDGTKATSVRWKKHNFLVKLLESHRWDCGALCVTWNTSVVWERTVCTLKKPFICQYQIPATKTPPTPPTSLTATEKEILATTTPPTSPTSLMVTEKALKRKRPAPPVRKSNHRQRTVMKKVQDAFFVTGSPVLDRETPTVTMCSRLCQKQCSFFNFNSETLHCRGFSSYHQEISGYAETHWEVWRVFFR